MAPPRRTRRLTPSAAGGASNEADNPYLPSIETQQTFSYGGSATPALPRPLGSLPAANTAADVAASIEAAITRPARPARPAARPLTESAGFHQIEDEARKSPEKQRVTRGQQRRAESMTPPREPVRRMTPDIQLMGSLREASGEPEDHDQQQQQQQQQQEQQSDDPVDLLADAIDGSSISWNTERHLLANERPAFGLTGWPRPTSMRPQMSPSQASSTSIHQTTQQQYQQQQHPRQQQSLQKHHYQQLRGQPQRSRATAERIERGIAIGPPVGLTTITTTTNNNNNAATTASPSVRPETPSDQPAAIHTPQSEHTPASSRPPSALDNAAAPTSPTSPSPSTSPSGVTNFGFMHVVCILLSIMMALNGYLLRDEIASAARSIIYSPSGHYGMANCTESISQMMAAVDQRLTSMTKDISFLKQEVNKATTSPPPPKPPVNPLEPRRPNFFSLGFGATVDPYLSSPTLSSTTSYLDRLRRLAGGIRPGPSHVSALQPWDDIGDCWCASTTSITSTTTSSTTTSKKENRIQLAVELGRPIVPEEVIVEHMPREATLDNGAAAPQLMELWGEFSDSSSVNSDEVRSALAAVWPGEAESAYAHEPSLGPSFVRLGRWQYDIHAAHHIQRFTIAASAVHDLPATSKVVVVARSNWGRREYTCLYRLRLHGRL
ncbi:TPA_exp: Uncharacterized protein A8136_4582 [Trichophyton benhamiae CBS 112371]|uniref:SUN domain-containing protein n=1 Tax=Arthroderma benhamiae (strain ATCC MYA-4681 / CBS 112371) TaxID=663331 RepID=D4B2M7_ARTBC|nr:uncharacterized protein ARB_02710 [Trichophyton benhamiae CBS 112371]EFE30338.1 conserved hypothetical protein [Trichophyton benhamiae CBS 112371]DAA73553.1 TPA_exp: Uncharacterized protein A8136_4582 [Trichophyton benhamiae CBS 112371]